MFRRNPIIFLVLILVVSLGIVFLAHITLLQIGGYPKFGNKIILSYGVNGLLAFLIYSSLYAFRTRLKNQIGFLFIAGSFLKFIFFFVLFYPLYRQDGQMDKSEFFAFFVPYLICLLIETVFTVKMLQNLDKK